MELMQTREFDAITVQDLLDRAGVGRATFYSHFRNKDDFLLTGFEGMLGALEARFEQGAGSGRRLAPVGELFQHLRDATDFRRGLERSRHVGAMYDIASGHLARIIERRLRALGVTARRLPATATARAVAAMAIELAKWWLDRETSFSARDMDAQFHNLAWSGLAQGGSSDRARL